MKQIQKIAKKSYCHKLLATSIAAACTAMVATSVTQASDIEIYQEAKSGQITLMFMLDISGSMDDYDTTSSGTTGNELSTNGADVKTYTRYYKSVNGTTTRLYYYKRTGGSSNRKWWSCGAGGATDQSDCSIALTSTPSTSGMNNTSSSDPRYYYKDTTEQVKYYNRITRVKDGMFDLLYGNATRGITKISDDKVIGLSTLGAYHNNNVYHTGAILVPARRLDCVYGKADCSNMPNNGKTQRTILLETIAGLGSQTWTPTARSYAETAAYLFGAGTTGRTTINIPKFFTYYPLLSTTKTYFYRRKGNSTSNYTYWSCGMNGTTSYTEANCNNSISKAVFDAGISGLTNDVTAGSGSSTNRYYWKNILAYSTTPSYQKCTAFTSSGCTTWSTASNTNPTTADYTGVCTVSGNSGMCAYEPEEFLNTTATGSGFPYSAVETKNAAQTRYQMPASLQQNDEIKQCSGQGIYVLTDGIPNNNTSTQGLIRTALNDSTFSCTSSDDGWDCTHKLVQSLLNPAKNPAGLKIKTAVVGFGNAFNNVTSYDKTKSQQDNITALGTIDSNVKRAAYWGIIGEGGWYSGNSSQDVVDSVNSFIDNLSTDIPAVTTGSPTIPKDVLNPVVLQDDAYYQQFQPTPDKSYQLWIGNMKKYFVANGGILKGCASAGVRDSKNCTTSANVTDSKARLITPTYDDNGKLITATYDFWSASVDIDNTTIADGDENTIGSRKFAARGGTWSQLKLGTATDGTLQRKLLTNRVGTGTGASANFNDGTSLRRVTLDYLTEATYKDDPERGYLMSLLGYAVDAANPATITTASLATTPELRQTGSVMHSLPVLVTNKGKVAYNASTKTIGSTNREDYVLFGTTQGLLHVVDAMSGQEKFAFVPNEMIENQKEAFINYTATNGGMSNLFYGIDGPWALHTEYVIDGSGNLTVGTGKGTNQKGKQLALGGLRMGGRSYYALDLQNINDPKLHFHVNPDGVTTGALSHMGQSWSKPSIGYVNWNGTRKLVMFVGGGYDAGYEADSYNQTNKKGAGVYMFSADGSDKGTLLWWASANATTSTGTTLPIGRKDDNMKYSVVSEIRTVDRNGDDLIDHLYFGDLGGQVFRIDLDNKATALTGFSKAPVRLLNLNAGSSGKSPRFYEMPSFSVYTENGEIFAVISVGSGNRSKPLQSYTTGTANTNYDAIYNIYDKDVASKSLFTTGSSNTANITRATLGKITETNRYSNTTLVAPYASKNGWYYEFDNCVAGLDGTKTGCSDYKLQSEKVFGSPLAMNYRLYVSTFDSSKPGISGDCGAGVKGESLLTTFCLPYGQCKTTADANRGTPIGVGIHNVTVGNCTGDDCEPPEECTGDDCDDNGGGNKKDKVASASNYCASTGGRMTITVQGGVGKGEATQMCLIPQRWYEKVSLK